MLTRCALACSYLCTLVLLACPRGDDAGLDEASSTDASSTDETTSGETGSPYGEECVESATVTAFYDALELIGSLGSPEDCTILAVETMVDSMAMGVDLDCGVPIGLDLEPAMVQPALAVDQQVRYGTENHFLGCFPEDSFVMREPGNDLIAAGLFSDSTHVELDLGSAGLLAFDYIANDEGCIRLDVTVAGRTTRLAARSTQAIQAGGQTWQIDVGDLRVPNPAGDDCGGDYRLFNVLVIRVP